MNSRDIETALDGNVAILTLSRPDKRNAIRDETIEALGNFFARPPAGVGAVLLRSSGAHFSRPASISASTANGTHRKSCTTRRCGIAYSTPCSFQEFPW